MSSFFLVKDSSDSIISRRDLEISFFLFFNISRRVNPDSKLASFASIEDFFAENCARASAAWSRRVSNSPFLISRASLSLVDLISNSETSDWRFVTIIFNSSI